MTDFDRTPGNTGIPKTNDTPVAFDADLSTPLGGSTPVGESTAFTPPSTAFDENLSASDDASTPATGAKQTLKDEAGKLTAKAGEKARGIADEGKLRATSALDEFSRLMDDAAGTVDEKLGEQYGQYARSAAQAISGFSDDLRGKEVEDLLADAREFVRKSPAIAIGTAAALGFVLSRIVKAGVDTTTDPVTKA
ncbi:hypothetical protein [Sphingomonas sp. CFBP 13720]|uniref:hypothetical protein n=1 Tax=Sphingomonas sp. CFBP 13720 TaxID=2775302 RepID=UPI002017C83C|nr:hypothetical protein [Sphingomonas sp. CFBP 13720]